jgi:hypothetical protein
MMSENIPEITKEAFPIKEDREVAKPFDVEKWVNVARGITSLMRNYSYPFNKAFDALTAAMDKNERVKFSSWFKFYKSNEHLKYKFAQSIFYTTDDGMSVPIRKDPFYTLPEDINSAKKIEEEENNELKKAEEEERKKLVKEQKKKLVSRLDSIEKILRSEDGQTFVGEELEFFIDRLFDLKKRINKLHKKASPVILEALFLQAANNSNYHGFKKAASSFLIEAMQFREVLENDFQKLADDPKPNTTPKTPVAVTAPVAATAPVAPAAVAAPKAVVAPKAPVAPKANEAPKPTSPENTKPEYPEKPQDAIEKLRETNDSDVAKIDDTNLGVNFNPDQITDSSSNSSLNNFADVDVSELIAFAQAAPAMPPPVPPAPEKVPAPANDDVKPPSNDNDVDMGNLDQTNKGDPNKFDAMIDNLMTGVSIQDIVNKLEQLSQIHRRREIPKQLSLVDLMLSAKGLASLFPQLSEATNKSLDANNYISSRIDSILSNLKGVINTKQLDLEGDNDVKLDAETDAIKSQLEDQRKKDEKRKQDRKEFENKKQDLEQNKPTDKPEEDVVIDEQPAPEVSTTPTK